jgi:Mannose-6-phosphate isomerase
MKTAIHLLIGVLLGILVSVFGAKMAMAQDPVEVASNIYKVLLENDRVRVLEVRLKAGEKTAMHSHPAHLVYILRSGGGAVFTSPDGKTTEVENKPGQVVWNEAVTHSVENVGTTEAQVLVIELKGPKK